MTSQETIGAIRFGYGVAGARHTSPEGLLSGLSGGNAISEQYPGHQLPDALPLIKTTHKAKDPESAKALRIKRKAAIKKSKELSRNGLRVSMARILGSDRPFFERLVWFWADHFTVAPSRPVTFALSSVFIDDAIRPNVTGRFADLLKATVTHPSMLEYLDQKASAGPNSGVGQRRNSGLNENLSREILELHTLGVGADYTQTDVRQFAELLTGLTYRPNRGYMFRQDMAEPGSEVVLGKSYGDGTASFRFIEEALEDLAVHPATAHHIARKLATHFVSDRPDPDLVASLEGAYRKSGGQLYAVYEALLSHPTSYHNLGAKVRQPFDYVATCLTAVGATPDDVLGLTKSELNRLLWRPLRQMGQPFLRAPGPDGWPEDAEHWITPQGLANRINFAFAAARHFEPVVSGIDRFLDGALAEVAGPYLRFGARAAETKTEAIALILASAEMNRR